MNVKLWGEHHEFILKGGFHAQIILDSAPGHRDPYRNQRGSRSRRRGNSEETLKALSLDKTASPKELYDALVKRYNDPSAGAGKGSLGSVLGANPDIEISKPARLL